MENVTDRTRNPFGMTPPCERFVPGYGDVNAHFHLVGDHPGVHGGSETGVPFTGTPAAMRLQDALASVGLLETTGEAPAVANLFMSYRYPCIGAPPTADDYARLEPTFDAELRAIAPHVILPVGERTIDFVLRTYTSRDPRAAAETLHGTERHGQGFLVVPIREPAEWDDGDREHLVSGLRELLATDYRREADLGRFLPGGDRYLVR
ncbi:MAG: uracil-DNA glycosylase family protein [Halorientalis sp.]